MLTCGSRVLLFLSSFTLPLFTGTSKMFHFQIVNITMFLSDLNLSFEGKVLEVKLLFEQNYKIF